MSLSKTRKEKTSGEKDSSSKLNKGLRLKHLRKMAGLSRKDVENKYQISANTLRSWEDGIQTGLTPQGAKRMLLALLNEGIRCSIGWLLSGEGNPPTLANKAFGPSKPARHKATKVTSIDLEDAAAIKSELKLFYELHDEAEHQIVPDDGMEPFYHKGDYVAGLKRYEDAIADLVGKNCIVETTVGKKYVRQLRSGSKPGYYHLVCLNIQTNLPNPIAYDVELISAAPIIWHRIKEH